MLMRGVGVVVTSSQDETTGVTRNAASSFSGTVTWNTFPSIANLSTMDEKGRITESTRN
jgi:hypothetical protein